MEEAQKVRLRAFFWDQFIRPFYAFANISILKIIFLVFLISAIIIKLNPIIVYAAALVLFVIFSYEIYKYYQSGEFMHNYRKYKYTDYKKATKVFKREAKTKKEEIAPEQTIEENENVEEKDN